MLDLVNFNKNIKEVTTTTLKIAEVFEKRHDRVLRAVNRILGDVRDIEDFTHPKNEVSKERKISPIKFMLDSYIDDSGKQCKQYVLNKEAFYLLAMGFTGKKALQFKLQFINAFNAMEKALTEKNTDKPVLVSEHTRALPSGKKEIVLSEKAKQEIGGIVKAVANKAVEDYFNDRIDEKFMVSMRNWMKEIITGCIRAEIAPYMLKDGIKQTEAFNGSVTADGLPVANWIVGIIHGANALDSCIKQLKNKQNQAVKLLEN